MKINISKYNLVKLYNLIILYKNKQNIFIYKILAIFLIIFKICLLPDLFFVVLKIKIKFSISIFVLFKKYKKNMFLKLS